MGEVTQSGHTYAVGFHNISGEQVTEKLDLALLDAIKLIKPSG